MTQRSLNYNNLVISLLYIIITHITHIRTDILNHTIKHSKINYNYYISNVENLNLNITIKHIRKT